MPQTKPHIAIVDEMSALGKSAIVQFELDGRYIGKLEIKNGVVQHAAIVHLYGERALHVLRRLPERVVASVTPVPANELHARSLVSAAWLRTGIRAARANV